MSTRQNILDYLTGTLFPSITIGNGYNFTVAISERGVRGYETMNDSEFPALFVASADESRESKTRTHFQSTMNVFVYGMVKADASIGRVQVQLDKLIEDLTKAIFVDCTQGGRTTWTDIKSINCDDGDIQDHGFFIATIEFGYMATTTSP